MRCLHLLTAIVALVGSSHAVEVMTMVRRRLLGLKDGGGGIESEKMQVIGAGFGRTGTESLCSALTTLGYKTYHGTKAIRYGHLPGWNSFFATGDDNVLEELEKEGFNATTDFPASPAYKTFVERNPNSKVVLSIHPRGGKGWAKSFLATLLPLGQIVQQPPFRYLKPFKEFTKMCAKVRETVGIELDSDGGISEEKLEIAYEAWLKAVKNAVPPGRLLVHSAVDGWGPLCAFLGLERGGGACPTEDGDPYPRVNDTEDLFRQINVLGSIAFAWPFVPPIASALVVAFLVRCCRGKRGAQKQD